MIVVAAAATILVGCKKEKDETTEKANTEATALLDRIHAFQQLRDAVNSGLKTDGTMTVEEMWQTLDLVSNYEHSKHQIPCRNKTIDTIRIAMPAVVNGSVAEADVVAAYEEFETCLQKRMDAATDGRNTPRFFSILMPETDAKDGDITIVFTKGEAVRSVDFVRNDTVGVFEEDDNYIWGLNLGHCISSSGAFDAMDAADALSQVFQYSSGGFTTVSRVEYAGYAPSYINNNYTIHYDNTIQCADKWLFYDNSGSSTEPCVDYEEMNCYYFSIYDNIASSTAPLHYGPTGNAPYIECTVMDTYDSDSARVHAAIVVYGYVN